MVIYYYRGLGIVLLTNQAGEEPVKVVGRDLLAHGREGGLKRRLVNRKVPLE